MNHAIRPTVSFLSEESITMIIDEGMEALCTIGVHADNPNVLSLLGDHSAKVDVPSQHVLFTRDMIETAVKTYANEVRARVFPSDAYTYPMCDEPAPVTKKPKMTGS